jgi:putrescine aminotransferase
LAEAYPTTISAIHGTGLMYGLEFNTPAQAGNVLVDLAQAGLLLSPCLSAPRTIRLLPPMVTTEPELQLAIDLLHTALAQLADLPVEDEIQTPGVQPSAVSLGEPEVG